MSRCITVTGVVGCGHVSADDGDFHMRLKLDPGQDRLLTVGNQAWTCGSDPSPRLVLEIIPQHCVVRPDNCADLGGFTDPPIPSDGEHVSVTGPWLLDTAHFNGSTLWAEIHPVWAVRQIR